MLIHKFNIVFVSVVYYHTWPKIMIRSLRQYFDNEVILVNHLKTDLPPEYFDNNCTILHNNNIHITHGAGIDVAVEHLKEREINHFIHIEPDCVIYGTKWFDDLIDAINNGAIMAGPCKLPFGPIHPCPSIWDINRTFGSFNSSDRLISQMNCNTFNYQKMVKWLNDINMPETGIKIWSHKWDCGIRNWYEASKQQKAIQTSSIGFKHFWEGRNRPPESLSKQDYELIEKYLY